MSENPRDVAVATFDITFADLRLAISVAQRAKRLDIIERLKTGLLLWIRQYERLLAAKVSGFKLLEAATSFAAWEHALLDVTGLNDSEES